MNTIRLGPEELNHGPVIDGGTVIEIHDKAGAEVLIETICKALTHDRDWYQENDPQSLVDSIREHNSNEPPTAS